MTFLSFCLFLPFPSFPPTHLFQHTDSREPETEERPAGVTAGFSFSFLSADAERPREETCRSREAGRKNTSGTDDNSCDSDTRQLRRRSELDIDRKIINYFILL